MYTCLETTKIVLVHQLFQNYISWIVSKQKINYWTEWIYYLIKYDRLLNLITKKAL
jgi:hypothetical protein